jgi:Rrf2 family protein
MRLTKRVEYSVRALVALAVAEPAPVTARTLADSQDIPPGYLNDLLADLRRVELVYARRGHHGGYALRRPANEITLGTVLRLLDGSPTDVPLSPEADADESRLPARLRHLWQAANGASMRLLDEVTIADIVSDSLPDSAGTVGDI